MERREREVLAPLAKRIMGGMGMERAVSFERRSSEILRRGGEGKGLELVRGKLAGPGVEELEHLGEGETGSYGKESADGRGKGRKSVLKGEEVERSAEGRAGEEGGEAI